MRKPHPPGTPVDVDRVREWVAEFAGYRVGVTEGRIDRWIEQFDETDRDLAARLLDAVDFIGHDQVSAAFREILKSLDGWSANEKKRTGRWLFAPFSESAGESGDQMLHRFRHANNLSGGTHNSLFCHRSELVMLDPGPDDTVVLVDDFSGTGDQACRAWESTFSELLPQGPRVILVLVAASRSALDRIRRETGMDPRAHVELRGRDNLLSDSCQYFTPEDKGRVRHYGGVADPENPCGRGESGFVLVFAHTCPNNSIPILHARRRRQWEGLFRRYD